jgi:homoserine dehydrogenase
VKFIQTVPAAVIVELSTLNAETGQPALDHIRLALQLRRHVVSANKGPVAVAYRALREAAEKYQRAFLFESTVMDGTPIFSMARQSLPAIEIQRIRGILNSTTNSILTRMESGASFAEAVKEMQEAGIAEADPSNDIDGWDAAAKIAILASVLMDGDVHPTDVHRIGIGGLTTEELQLAQREGRRIKLVCEAHRDGETIRASVRPTALPGSDPLSQAEGTANIISFETDAIPYLVIHEEGGGPLATAYGVLADLIHIARGTYQ